MGVSHIVSTARSETLTDLLGPPLVQCVYLAGADESSQYSRARPTTPRLGQGRCGNEHTKSFGRSSFKNHLNLTVATLKRDQCSGVEDKVSCRALLSS